MKRLITRTLQMFNNTYDFLKHKNKYDIQNSAIIITVLFLIFMVGGGFSRNISVIKVTGCVFFVIFFAMALVIRVDVKGKIIPIISKGACNTPREMLKRFNHVSYIYGLTCFSIETCILLEVIVYLLTGMMFTEFRLIDGFDLWIAVMFIYTFFYFAYHIYFAETKEKIEFVKLRMQFYAAIGTTVSFMMLLFGENYRFKVFIVGTMLEYTWLQYFITKELRDGV